MAKSASVKIVRVPQFGGRSRRAGALVRRGASAAARAAMTERHTIAAVGAAAVLGLARRQGVALPSIAALGVAGTYGVAAWALGRMTKSRVAEHVATGLLSVAAYELAAGAAGAVSGEEGGEI